MTARRVSALLAWLLAFSLAAHRDERGFWNPLPDFKGILNAIGSLFSDLRDAAFDTLAALENGLLQVVNGVLTIGGNISYIVQTVGLDVWNGITAGFGAIGDLVHWFGQLAVNTLIDAASHFSDWAGRLGMLLVAGVRDTGGAVHDVLSWFGQLLVNAISSAGGSVTDLVKWFGTQIVNTATDVGGALRDAATSLATTFANGVTDVGGALVDRIEHVGESILHIGDRVGSAVEGVGEKGIQAALDHKTDLLTALVGGPALEAIVHEMGGWQRVGDDVVAGLRVGGKDVKSFAGDTFTYILDAFIGTGHIEPDAAPAQAAQALAIATAFGLAAQVPGIVQGLLPTENPTATTYLGGFLGKFAGWDLIIEAVLGTAIYAALHRPMEQHLNEQTTTNIPRERDLDELLSRRKIDAETYTKYHRRHGYTDGWTTHMLDAAYHPARIFELARIMRFVDISDDQLDIVLNDAGYRPDVVDLLRPALHALARNTSTAKLVSEAFTALSDGFIDGAAFGAAMDAAGITPAEQGLMQLAAETAYSRTVKSEMLSAFRSRAAADALTDDELRAGLAGLGIEDRKIIVEVARANIARLKKPVHTVDKAHEAAVNKTRATLTAAYKLQLRKGLISADQLQAQLVLIGIPGFQAAAIVELTKAEMFTPPKVDQGNTPVEVSKRVHKNLEDAYVLQFRTGKISADQLHSQLVAIGINDLEAQTVVAREQARKKPAAVTKTKQTAATVAKQLQDTLAAAYVEQFAKWLISGDQLEADLIAVGLTPEVAHAKRLLEDARRTKKPSTVP